MKKSITTDELFEDALEEWKTNKGKGTAIVSYPLDDKYLLYNLLQKVYNKNPETLTVIVLEHFTERSDIVKFLTTQEDEHNNEEFNKLIENKKIKLLSSDYIENSKIRINPGLCVPYHIDSLGFYVEAMIRGSKFTLTIINRILSDVNKLSILYELCPILNTFNQDVVDIIRLSTPVEEIQIGVDIPENTEDYKLLKYYDEYITVSLNLFGSFNNIELCRVGSNELNISATAICSQIAAENGWSPNLDMSSELNVKIDELYNPNNIKDRAIQTYNIIRDRNTLLSDYKAKLNEIYKIIVDNPNDKILIINKHGDFANVVTDYINNLSEKEICGNYHDRCEPMPAFDENDNPIYYKSGTKAGERRYFMDKAQRSYNQRRFVKDKLRVLSTNNSPDKSLYIHVNTVIITSPQCKSIADYMYQLSQLHYIDNKLKLFTIYIKNSVEQSKLENKEKALVHSIVKNCENNVKIGDNSDFIIAD